MSNNATALPSPSAGARLLAAFVFVVAFALGVGVLMFLNTVVLGLGDNKFGSSGWKVYWPFWGVVFTPAAIVFAVQSFRIPSERGALIRFFAPSLILLLVTIEVSFLLDLHWPWVIVEFFALFAISEFLVRARRGA